MNPHSRVLFGTIAILAFASACTSSDSDASDSDASDPTVSESLAEASEELPSLPTAFTPVIGNTVSPEMATVYASDGRWHLVYELTLTNAKQVPATIGSIEVLDAYDTGMVLKLITADEIVEETFQLSGRPRLEPDSTTLLGDDGVLVPNESTVLFIEMAFDDRADVPDAIVHRFTGLAALNPGSTEPAAIEYLFVTKAITERTAASIAPPLRGDGWTVVNGCCLANGAHRGSIQTVNGDLWNAKRFAIDWMKIGENGRFFDGDPSDVTSWYNYGEPVYAVADGTVIEVLDELPDQDPGTLPDPADITIETVDGNHVILDLGGGVYAFYAHLKLGSVSVELGDKVEVGQQIGELGNSGNTSGPHLHLHLMSEPSALAADSIPYGYEDIEFTGNVSEAQWDNTTDELGDVWNVTPDTRPGLDRPVLPMNLNVVTFLSE
jgi:hypothetical protein